MNIELLAEWITEYLATLRDDFIQMNFMTDRGYADIELSAFIQWIKENKLS